MIRVISGNEPYLVDYQKRKLLDAEDSFNFHKSNTFGEEEIIFLSTSSLFGGERTLLLNIKELKELDTSEFKSLVEKNPEGVRVVAVVENLDKRLNIYKLLKQKQILIECNKYQSEKSVIQVLLLELKKLNANIRTEAMHELIKRSHYFEREDITLYHLVSNLTMLACFNSAIELEDVKSLIQDMEKENIFSIANLLKKNDLDGILKQAHMIEKGGSSVIGTLSALLREFRIAFKYTLYEGNKEKIKEIGAFGGNKFPGMSLESIRNCMQIVIDAIDSIKSGELDEEDAILITIEKLHVLVN